MRSSVYYLCIYFILIGGKAWAQEIDYDWNAPEKHFFMKSGWIKEYDENKRPADDFRNYIVENSSYIFEGKVLDSHYEGYPKTIEGNYLRFAVEVVQVFKGELKKGIVEIQVRNNANTHCGSHAENALYNGMCGTFFCNNTGSDIPAYMFKQNNNKKVLKLNSEITVSPPHLGNYSDFESIAVYPITNSSVTYPIDCNKVGFIEGAKHFAAESLDKDHKTALNMDIPQFMKWLGKKLGKKIKHDSEKFIPNRVYYLEDYTYQWNIPSKKESVLYNFKKMSI
jgi:hypothetical protein